MNCPHCSAILDLNADECRACGFSVATVRVLLGAEWIRLERITDSLNCLSLKEERSLEISLDEFERDFPQCFLAVFIGALPAGLTAGDLGFWLINHGAFHTQQIAKRNDFGVTFVIDCQHHQAAITVGYALERLLTSVSTGSILNQLRGLLTRQHYGQAAGRAVELIRKRLAETGKTEPPQPPSGRIVADLSDMGLQPLRAAHRSPRSGHPA